MGSFSHLDDTSPIVLTVPGLGGSGPSHWQTLWEESRPDVHRVELGMWNTPHRNAWVTRLDQAIRTAQAPVVIANQVQHPGTFSLHPNHHKNLDTSDS